MAVLRLITELEFRGLLDRHIRGFSALQNLAHKRRTPPKRVGTIGAVGNRPPTSANDRGTVAAGRRCLSASSAVLLDAKLPCTTTAPAPSPLHGRRVPSSISSARAHHYGGRGLDACGSARKLELVRGEASRSDQERFTRAATRPTDGSMSRNSSTHLPCSSAAISDMPVMFPPWATEARHQAGSDRIARHNDYWNLTRRLFAQQAHRACKPPRSRPP